MSKQKWIANRRKEKAYRKISSKKLQKLQKYPNLSNGFVSSPPPTPGNVAKKHKSLKDT